MANPLLRHYKGSPSANAVWTQLVPNVPTGRALVIGKLLISSEAVLNQLYVEVSNAVPSSSTINSRIVAARALGFSDVYEEGPLVLVAGEGLWVHAIMATAADFIKVACHAFGEEVDNV